MVDTDHAAPHLVDAEVVFVIRRQARLGLLDPTAALQAVDDLRDWPGERWPHRHLLDRVWDLRHSLRSYDAFYVALAETLDATFLTRDNRIAAAAGIDCTVEVI